MLKWDDQSTISTPMREFDSPTTYQTKMVSPFSAEKSVSIEGTDGLQFVPLSDDT